MEAFLLSAIVFLITFHIHAKQFSPRFGFHSLVNSPVGDFLKSPDVDTPPVKKKPLRITQAQIKSLDSLRSTDSSLLGGASKPFLNETDKKQRAITDSVVKGDTTRQDSLIQTKDTLNVRLSKDSLQAPVNYEAEDSGVLIIPTKEFLLYGKAKAKYMDVAVSAATIRLNQQEHRLSAYGSLDTSGNPLNKPKLVQGDMTSISDTINYDTKSQKGLTKGTYLQEGEMYVYAQTVKKVDENTLYAWRGRFTTCNLDTPHFAFRTRKLKMISKKIAVSGPAAPEFEGVPMPIGIPFGIYPLNRGRHSGLLPPQYAANDQYGIGLEGLGYYKVLNDNVDVTVRTNFYSYGGWNLNVSSRYLRRYRYNGSVNLAIQNVRILNNSGFTKEEFTKSRNYSLQWSYARDAKARPGSTFNANVNLASTQFNRYVANNAIQNFQNSLSSSITYSKDWKGKYNLTVSANHNQNNNTRLINLSLPTATFNVTTIYPFQKSEVVGTPKWYEKLGIGYTGSYVNQIAFYDSAFNLRNILDTAQYGATHTIPISLSLPPLGVVQVAPGVSYEEHWFGQKFIRAWNPVTKKLDTTITKGLYTARQMSFNLSASTRIFGTAQFKKGSVKAIRHEIRPTVSLTYKPDMAKRYFYNVQRDSFGNIGRYSIFEGNIIGSFSEGRFGGIGFGVDNVLEMKTRNKKDTAASADRKVKLIDGFGFQGSYNLFPSLNDSFPLSNINLYLRSTLFNKINITASANLDPYQVTDSGSRLAHLVLKDQFPKLGRITNGSIAISSSFQSKAADGKSDKDRIPQDDYMTPDEQQRQLEYIRSNPAEYADFNIPWTVSFSYSLSFYRQIEAGTTRLKTTTNSNASVNGDFSLTPKWKVGGNTYYDFNTKKIQTLSLFVSREMHCWQMSINLSPIGLYRSFSINISPKSGLLRDLKINRSRFFYQ